MKIDLQSLRRVRKSSEEELNEMTQRIRELENKVGSVQKKLNQQTEINFEVLRELEITKEDRDKWKNDFEILSESHRDLQETFACKEEAFNFLQEKIQNRTPRSTGVFSPGPSTPGEIMSQAIGIEAQLLQYEEKIETLTRDWNEAKEEYEKTISTLQLTVKQITKEKNSEAERYANDLKALEQRWEDQLRTSQEDKDRIVGSYENKFKSMLEQNEALRKASEIVSHKCSSLESDIDTERNYRIQEVDDLIKKHQVIVENCEKKLEELSEKHSENIKRLESEIAKKSLHYEEFVKSMEIKLNSQEEKYKQDIAKQNEDHLLWQNKSDNQIAKMRAEIESTKLAHETEIKQLIALREQESEKSKKEISAIAEQLEESKCLQRREMESYEGKMQELQATYETKIDNLNCILKEKESALVEEISVMKQRSTEELLQAEKEYHKSIATHLEENLSYKTKIASLTDEYHASCEDLRAHNKVLEMTIQELKDKHAVEVKVLDNKHADIASQHKQEIEALTRECQSTNMRAEKSVLLLTEERESTRKHYEKELGNLEIRIKEQSECHQAEICEMKSKVLSLENDLCEKTQDIENQCNQLKLHHKAEIERLLQSHQESVEKYESKIFYLSQERTSYLEQVTSITRNKQGEINELQKELADAKSRVVSVHDQYEAMKAENELHKNKHEEDAVALRALQSDISVLEKEITLQAEKNEELSVNHKDELANLIKKHLEELTCSIDEVARLDRENKEAKISFDTQLNRCKVDHQEAIEGHKKAINEVKKIYCQKVASLEKNITELEKDREKDRNLFESSLQELGEHHEHESTKLSEDLSAMATLCRDLEMQIVDLKTEFDTREDNYRTNTNKIEREKREIEHSSKEEIKYLEEKVRDLTSASERWLQTSKEDLEEERKQHIQALENYKMESEQATEVVVNKYEREIESYTEQLSTAKAKYEQLIQRHAKDKKEIEEKHSEHLQRETQKLIDELDCLVRGKKDIVSLQEEKIKSLESKLSGEKTRLQCEVEKLREAEIEMKKEYEGKIHNFYTEIAKYKENEKELNAAHGRELQALRQNIDQLSKQSLQNVTQVQQESENRLLALNEEKDRNTAELEKKIALMHTDQEKALKEWQKEMQEIVSRHNEEITTISENHSDMISTLEKEKDICTEFYLAKVETLEENIMREQQQHADEKEALLEKHRFKVQQYEIELDKAAFTINEKSKINEKMKIEHENEVAVLKESLEQSYQQKLSTEKQDFEAQINRIICEREKDNFEFQANLKKMQEGYEKSIQQLEEKIAKNQQEQVDFVQTITTDHSSRVKLLTEERKKLEREFNEKLQEMEKKQCELTNEHKSVVDGLQEQHNRSSQDYEKRISLLSEECHGVYQKLTEIKEEHELQLQSLKAEVQSKDDIQNDLRCQLEHLTVDIEQRKSIVEQLKMEQEEERKRHHDLVTILQGDCERQKSYHAESLEVLKRQQEAELDALKKVTNTLEEANKMLNDNMQISSHKNEEEIRRLQKVHSDEVRILEAEIRLTKGQKEDALSRANDLQNEVQKAVSKSEIQTQTILQLQEEKRQLLDEQRKLDESRIENFEFMKKLDERYEQEVSLSRRQGSQIIFLESELQEAQKQLQKLGDELKEEKSLIAKLEQENGNILCELQSAQITTKELREEMTKMKSIAPLNTRCRETIKSFNDYHEERNIKQEFDTVSVDSAIATCDEVFSTSNVSNASTASNEKVDSRVDQLADIGALFRKDDEAVSYKTNRESRRRSLMLKEANSNSRSLRYLDNKASDRGRRTSLMAPTFPLPSLNVEDEPDDYDWSMLSRLNEQTSSTHADPNRLNELQRRNTLCLPHLKSSYPMELCVASPSRQVSEDKIKGGPEPSLTTSRKRTSAAELSTSTGKRNKASESFSIKSSKSDTVLASKSKLSSMKSNGKQKENIPEPPVTRSNLAFEITFQDDKKADKPRLPMTRSKASSRLSLCEKEERVGKQKNLDFKRKPLATKNFRPNKIK